MAQLTLIKVVKKNPITKQTKWYLQKSTYSLIGNDALIARIAQNTALPASVINAATSAIFDSVANFCANGHSVQFGTMMSIRPVIQSQGVTSMDLVNAKQVKAIQLRVYWGNDLRPLQEPENYTFVTAELQNSEPPGDE